MKFILIISPVEKMTQYFNLNTLEKLIMFPDESGGPVYAEMKFTNSDFISVQMSSKIAVEFACFLNNKETVLEFQEIEHEEKADEN